MTAFHFVEFNPCRAARGAEAARVEVFNDDGSIELLWMSKRDIAKNMMSFGRCDELVKAHAAYEAPKERPRCLYPDCNCPFDAPGDPNWCARGLPRATEQEKLHG